MKTILEKESSQFSQSEDEKVDIELTEETSIVGLLNNHFKYAKTLVEGIKWREYAKTMVNDVVESKIIQAQRKGNASYHKFAPELATFGYFIKINKEIYYIGFDYNCKVECNFSEMATFFNQIKIESDIENQEFLDMLTTEEHSKK